MEAGPGFDLRRWLALLEDSSLTNTNDLIDLLRARGLSFVDASRVERIYTLGNHLLTAPEPVKRRSSDSRPAKRPERQTPEPAPSYPVWRSPEEHAQRLVAYLQERQWRTGEVLSREIQGVYQRMCEDLGWRPMGWRSVGALFRQLIGDRKHYRDFVIDGRRRRLCCYTLPGRDAPEARERLASPEQSLPVAAAA